MSDTVEKVDPAKGWDRYLKARMIDGVCATVNAHMLRGLVEAAIAIAAKPTPGARWTLPDGTEMAAVPVEAMDLAMQGLNDWLVTYADDLCDANDVAVARDHIRSAGGTIAYISAITAIIAHTDRRILWISTQFA